MCFYFLSNWEEAQMHSAFDELKLYVCLFSYILDVIVSHILCNVLLGMKRKDIILGFIARNIFDINNFVALNIYEKWKTKPEAFFSFILCNAFHIQHVILSEWCALFSCIFFFSFRPLSLFLSLVSSFYFGWVFIPESRHFAMNIIVH